jgi:thiol-disulfide isomerase/thioredoxin
MTSAGPWVKRSAPTARHPGDSAEVLNMPATPKPAATSSARLLRWGGVAAATLAAAAGAVCRTGAKRPRLLAGPAQAPADPRRLLLSGEEWLNSRPLAEAALRGKVILVNFWTYSCINSLRRLPYVRAWAKKYADRGLVVIGVHTPGFNFEKEVANVRRALEEYGVGYPILLDNDHRIWNAFGDQAFYFIGADGRVHRQIFGEGRYEESEKLIQALLSQTSGAPLADPITPIDGVGPQAAPDWRNIGSDETYVGYAKAEGFAPQGVLKRNAATLYRTPTQLGLNQWSLTGKWNVGGEYASLADHSGAITYRFHARDLNLVMALPPGERWMWFSVKIDGAPPGGDHGSDTDSDGWGRLDQPRLYHLVRQSRTIANRTFEIAFFGAGVRAYVFTFG